MMKRALNSVRERLSPVLLGLVRPWLQGGALGLRAKDGLWALSQRHLTFHGIERAVTLRNGMKMHVSSAPRVEQELFLFGEWEPLFTRYLGDIEKNDGLFIDIGSNIGYFALLASRTFAEVHAIEASPATADRLRANIALNGIGNIQVHCVAVGAESGTIRFYRDEGQSGGSSVHAGAGKVFETEVPVEPLEAILDGIDWARVRFIKIDVEGSEPAVLDSLFRIYETTDADLEIFVEFDPEMDATWPQIQRFFGIGFEAYMMQGVYERIDYLDRSRCTAMVPVDRAPEIFCDMLLRRSGSRGPGPAACPDAAKGGLVEC